MPRLRTLPGKLRGAHALAEAGVPHARTATVALCDRPSFGAITRTKPSTGNGWEIHFLRARADGAGKSRYNFGAHAAELYREIPGFIVNRSYDYLENRKGREISALDFLQKLTREFPRRSPPISGDFLTRPLRGSESSLGTPLLKGSKSYGFIEHDGEPAPSSGSTRARLQGNHHVDFQRAGRRDQPLRQGQQGFVASRRGHGGLGSPLHAQTGKSVM